MIRAPKGLEGVIVATTSLTKIDGQAGRLIYRGYDVTQLAGRVSYESVAHLLWYGHLPNRQELSTLETRFSREHVLPNQVIGFLKGESKVADPLSALQTSVSILGGLGSRNEPSLIDSSIGLERSIARRCAHLRLGDAAVHWDPRERRELVARSASEARQNNGLWPPSLSNRGPKIKGPKRACATDSRSLSIRTRDNGRRHGPETTT